MIDSRLTSISLFRSRSIYAPESSNLVPEMTIGEEGDNVETARGVPAIKKKIETVYHNGNCRTQITQVGLCVKE